MKVELHCHTRRYSGCARLQPAELMEQYVRAGYDAVYITEHDAVWPTDQLEELRREFPRLRIYPGVELMINGSLTEHVVVLGTNDPEYVHLRHDGPALLAKARSQGHLTVLAHPYRWETSATSLAGPILPDAMEYHTCNHDGEAAHQSLMESLRLGMRIVNAGDTHDSHFVNRFWVQTWGEILRPDDIRTAILEGAYRNEVGDLTDWHR